MSILYFEICAFVNMIICLTYLIRYRRLMNEVCRFIGSADFKRTGLEYIEVNLSVAQCMQERLAERILEVMENHGVSPDKINLEITETAAEYDQDIMMKNINKLYSRGISFSLDDYGTGYSNLERIMTLPLTIVKLDKIFGSADNDSKMCALLVIIFQSLSPRKNL